ncbi:MAG: RNA ligase family protein, partial [Myxococcota bacterium]
LGTIHFRGKIKLDGTNAGIQIQEDGTFLFQSRKHLIAPQMDNAGFATWATQQDEFLQGLYQNLKQMKPQWPVTVFGEWCGPGIQKGTSISQIDRKIFAVFAVLLGTANRNVPYLLSEPAEIEALLPKHADVFVLPWHTEPLALNFADPEQLEQHAEVINEHVQRVEQNDPWVSEHFHRQGTGEGIIFYPDPAQLDKFWKPLVLSLLFKAKGEKHQVVRQKRSAQVNPENLSNVRAFVAHVLTEVRLEQGLQEACAGQATFENTGAFLRWVQQDVRKENRLELESNQLTWKDVSKPLGHHAAKWFKARVLKQSFSGDEGKNH